MSDLSRRELLSRFIRPPRPRPEEETVRLPPPELLPPFLRPPGAGPESTFIRACSGCGDCATACPHNAILPLGPAYGDAQDTPAILPNTEPCRLCADQPCVAACEPGALSPVAEDAVQMGSLRVVPERCWAAMGQPCDYCITACPRTPAAIRATASGVEFDDRQCVGCGLCLYYCTATPRAIEIAQSGADGVHNERKAP